MYWIRHSSFVLWAAWASCILQGRGGWPEGTISCRRKRQLHLSITPPSSQASECIALAIWPTGFLRGELCVCGRQDSQVKVKGYRIELHEIEEVLTWHPAIHDAVCLVRERQVQGFSESYLCAFYQADSHIEADRLRQHLKSHLPDYMVPDAWAQLADFPLTANGKINRRAFPAIEISQPDLPKAEVQTRTQQIIYQTWTEILPTQHIGIHDNFFDVGGNSFHVVLVQKALAEQGIKVMAIDILEYATISGLADWYDRQQTQAEKVTCLGIPFSSAVIGSNTPAPEWEYHYGAEQYRLLEEIRLQLDVPRDTLLTGLIVYALAAATEQNCLDLYLGDGDAHCRHIAIDLTGVGSLPAFFERVVMSVSDDTAIEFCNLLPLKEDGRCSVYISGDDNKAVKRNSLFDLVFVFSGEEVLTITSSLNNIHGCQASFAQIGNVLNDLVGNIIS